MKIHQHPRMRNIDIGDEVYFHPRHLSANVIEVFPAAVCVRVGILAMKDCIELLFSPQLWRADDIENLSVCRHCGSREELQFDAASDTPVRVCAQCRTVAAENTSRRHGASGANPSP
jgi:hypothetical protein